MLNWICSKNKRKLLVLLSIFLVATLAISLLEAVNAEDITIGPNTPGGLKQAIESVASGDTIYLKNGVYNGKNNRGLEINKTINIVGKGNNVVIDGEKKDRIFSIRGSSKVTPTFQKLKIKNGVVQVGGGAILTSPTKTYKYAPIPSFIVIDCTFTNNKASQGGVLWGKGQVSNSIFINNQASFGGAIYISDKFSISNCTFTNNKASQGGAIFNGGPNRCPVSKSTFTNNKANRGGAIDTGGHDGSYTVSKSTFTNNKATIPLDGPGINAFKGGAIQGTSELIVIDCTFTNNKASYFGGAINTVGTVSKSTFTNNKASSHGGAICDVGTVSTCTFTSNQAKKEGGAIYNGVLSLKITNSQFTKNIASKTYNAISHATKNTFLKNVKIIPKDGTRVKR